MNLERERKKIEQFSFWERFRGGIISFIDYNFRVNSIVFN